EQPVVCFVFDLLYLDGFDLRAVPLRERKALLTTHLLTSDRLRLLSAIEEHGVAVAEAAQSLGYEGVVGKRADSRYEPGGRGRSWLKVKTVQEQEFVVAGYTPGEGGRRSTFGALAIGYYDADGSLRYAGNVGSGFKDGDLASVLKLLKPLETKQSPFSDRVDGVVFAKPEVVVQVKYAEWTKDGRLRAPVFLGVRNDVEPRNVHRETPLQDGALVAATSSSEDEPPVKDEVPPLQETPKASRGRSTRGTTSNGHHTPELVSSGTESLLDQLENPKQNFTLEVDGAEIKLTNLEKPFWPAHGETPPLTKRDLVRYYVKLGPTLLPHLKDRPLTLTRYPNGVAAKPFYQKHYEQPLPSFVETSTIWSESNRAAGEYILCNNLATLVWLGQLADLELHAWMARVNPEPDAHGRPTVFSGSERALEQSVLNYPDFMVFDLDPYIYAGHEAHGAEPEYNKHGWEKTVEIALALKALLDNQRFSSFIKTSGKTGLHIYCPVLRHNDYDFLRELNKTIGQFLMRQHPKDVTMQWDTTQRRGMVFFDAGQNTRGKTLAAQYSPRPTHWAGVSTPIAWAELEGLDPTALNLLTVPDRVAAKGDLWADILNRKADLSALLSV
ncbi:MAG TPA: ATP-dependent DNA ligase, partial [Dehalococcoidia bacterium]|nr:ATP-dependent DNA ligase [Dehalococcoidia bacterium]